MSKANIKKKLDITPETKIAPLLNHYPELETVLLEISPEFSKLQNPMLRKTIAKVTSLKQASQIGKIPLGQLINRLRKEVGQANVSEYYDDSENIPSEKPDWLKKGKIKLSMDARPLLEKGHHPVNTIMNKLHELKSDEMIELITPFIPAPLIDLAKKKGFKAWSQEKENLYFTYFKK